MSDDSKLNGRISERCYIGAKERRDAKVERRRTNRIALIYSCIGGVMAIKNKWCAVGGINTENEKLFRNELLSYALGYAYGYLILGHTRGYVGALYLPLLR